MGLFDTVTFPCPDCGEQLEFQSKGGECGMYTYDGREKVPVGVASDLGGSVMCRSCGHTFTAKAKKTVRVKLVRVN